MQSIATQLAYHSRPCAQIIIHSKLQPLFVSSDNARLVLSVLVNPGCYLNRNSNGSYKILPQGSFYPNRVLRSWKSGGQMDNVIEAFQLSTYCPVEEGRRNGRFGLKIGRSIKPLSAKSFKQWLKTLQNIAMSIQFPNNRNPWSAL